MSSRFHKRDGAHLEVVRSVHAERNRVRSEWQEHRLGRGEILPRPGRGLEARPFEFSVAFSCAAIFVESEIDV